MGEYHSNQIYLEPNHDGIVALHESSKDHDFCKKYSEAFDCNANIEPKNSAERKELKEKANASINASFDFIKIAMSPKFNTLEDFFEKVFGELPKSYHEVQVMVSEYCDNMIKLIEAKPNLVPKHLVHKIPQLSLKHHKAKKAFKESLFQSTLKGRHEKIAEAVGSYATKYPDKLILSYIGDRHLNDTNKYSSVQRELKTKLQKIGKKRCIVTARLNENKPKSKKPRRTLSR